MKQKAKAYDEALKRAKKLYERGTITESLSYIFPELKESDDEKIRKALIKLVKKVGEGYENVIEGVSIENAISWLEKQGEHANFRNKIQIGDKVTRNEDGVLINLSQLNRVAKKDEKQSEQKPADKVEPKFTVGDKIRRKTPRRYDKDMQVTRIESNYYLCNHLGKFSSEKISFSEESNYELVEQKPQGKSALKAAKEEKIDNANKAEPKFKVGDIVKHKDNPYLTYILKRFTDDGDYEFHAIGKDGNEGCTCFSVVKYQDEWELVEQKSAEWSEEDEKVINDIIRIIDGSGHVKSIREHYITKLKSLRPQKNNWERVTKEIYFKEPVLIRRKDKSDTWEGYRICNYYTLDLQTDECYIRIKDINNQKQWMPSEEQMVALDGICSYIRNKADWEISQDMVFDLYKLSEQLKKLKEK